MKLTVIGTGYAGVVTGACFAEMGNDILCVDVGQSKIERLNNGDPPIFEPGLADIVTRDWRAAAFYRRRRSVPGYQTR